LAVHTPGEVTDRRLARGLGPDDGCVLLVRPDGHIGHGSTGDDPARAVAYRRALARHGVT
jgi:hypothetical protein